MGKPTKYNMCEISGFYSISFCILTFDLYHSSTKLELFDALKWPVLFEPAIKGTISHPQYFMFWKNFKNSLSFGLNQCEKGTWRRKKSNQYSRWKMVSKKIISASLLSAYEAVYKRANRCKRYNVILI